MDLTPSTKAIWGLFLSGLVGLVIGMGLASDPALAEGTQTTHEQPNIVVIVTDDQSEGLFNRQLMPNTFSLLGSGGTRLRDFSVVTPLCCPSRAVQLTGQYGHNNGVLANDPGYPKLRDPANVLPAWLRTAGYETAHVGRFLNGYRRAGSPAAPAPGFDRWVGLMNLHYWDYRLSIDGRAKVVTGNAPGKYVTRQLHRRANRLLRDFARAHRPFFLQLDELAPHDDHAAGARCLRTALPGPEKLQAVRWVRLKRAALERNLSDKPEFIQAQPELSSARRTAIQQRLRCRAAAVREVDKGVGKMIRLLERTGEFENTVFVVYSDNGYFAGEHGLTKGKGLPYEQAVSVPALIRVPVQHLGGVTPARRSDIAAANIDIVPTLLELAGGHPCIAAGRCRKLDGRSLLPALTDPSAWPADRPILLEIDQPSRVAGATLGCTWAAVKRGDEVYVEYERVLMPGSEHCVETDDSEHYRLDSDPRQNHNLWPPRTEADKEAQRDLAAELDRLRDCEGSVTGTPSGNPCP
jgi:N-acetylglucosamine-6-sulfatase